MLKYKLKELRKREGLTQTELARALQVSVGAVGNWESGTRNPDVRMLRRIADCFSVTVEHLTGAEETAPATDTSADFDMCCNDDSMIGAGIRCGDSVHIRRQEDVEDGRIAAVQIDDKTVLRRVYRLGDCLVLQAENPAFKPMVFFSEERSRVRILGLAVTCVGLIR